MWIPIPFGASHKANKVCIGSRICSRELLTLYLSLTPQVRGKSSSGRQWTCSIGISPPPGTPPVAPFGYKSIIIPRPGHRPPRSATPFHPKYRWIAPSVFKGDHGAPFGLGWTAHRSSGQVMCWWNEYSVFSFSFGEFSFPHYTDKTRGNCKVFQKSFSNHININYPFVHLFWM